MKRYFVSFISAINGIKKTVTTQCNIRIQLFAALLVMLLAIYYDIPLMHLIWLITMCFMVIVLEMVNTALEMILNFVSPEYHPLAKISKDIAAGAVLLTSLMAVFVGLIIFLDLNVFDFPPRFPIDFLKCFSMSRMVSGLMFFVCLCLLFFQKKR